MGSIKIDLGGDVFSCREFYDVDSDRGGIEVKKGKKLIGEIWDLSIPSKDEDYKENMSKFNKKVEEFLDENYY
jgi:hypothetical protein